MKKFAVIGHPIAHSLSPKMHAANMAAIGFAGTYEKFDVAPEDVPAALKRFRAEGYLGINVTVKTVSKSTLQKNLKNREFDMVLCAVNLAVLPDLTFLLNSGGRMNYSGYSSADMNVLLQALYKTTDEETFKAAFSDIQILISDELPFLGLFFRKGTLMTTASVTGFSPIIEGNALQGFEYIEFH